MKLGYSPLTSGIVAVDDAFALAVELGLELVELSYDLFEAMPQAQPVAAVNALQRATGVETTVHLSYVDLNLAALAPVARRASVERTLAGLDYAAAIGAHCAVVHLGVVPLPDPRADALAAAALEESLTALEHPAVPLAVENLGLSTGDLPRSPAEMREALTRHGLAACLDVGHAHVQAGREGADLSAAYRNALADLTVHLHLHDNLGDHDAHLPVGEGSVPLMDWLPSSSLAPTTAVLEIASDGAALALSVRRIREILEGVRR